MHLIPQPPVQPAQRATEAREFWPAFIVALIGFVLLLAGARRLTGVETVQGSTAIETQLNKSFTSGGLQYASRLAPPPPPRINDSVPAHEALEEWQRQRANMQKPTWVVRVDLGAKTPCPT